MKFRVKKGWSGNSTCYWIISDNPNKNTVTIGNADSYGSTPKCCYQEFMFVTPSFSESGNGTYIGKYVISTGPVTATREFEELRIAMDDLLWVAGGITATEINNL